MRAGFTCLFWIMGLLSFGQNVGIGTNAPTQKLDINGTIRIREGNPGEGKVLASDANGTASWQRMESLSGQTVGFGSWGDCSMGNISHYNPVWDIDTSHYTSFGYSVFILGNYAIIGNPKDDFNAADNNLDHGSASIFEFNGTNWIFRQKLVDATSAPGDNFGTSVSISGNFAFIGAPLDDVGANVDQGSVTVFQFNGSNWIFLNKLTDATGGAGDNFGTSLWQDDTYAVIGSPLDDVGANNSQGSVVFFKYSGPNWLQSQKLTDPIGTASDFFGHAIDVDGNTMVIGAYNDGSAGDGSAHVFNFDGSSWNFFAKISKPFASAGPNVNFGKAVTIRDKTIFVGAPNDEVSTLVNQGVVYQFVFNGTSYQFRGRLLHPEATNDDNFGNSLQFSGNYLIVGSNHDDVNYGEGSAMIYQWVGRSVQRLQYTYDPGGGPGDQFGFAVSIDGNTGQFLIGAPFYENASGKAIFGKIRQ